jgi:hypothetical protein
MMPELTDLLERVLASGYRPMCEYGKEERAAIRQFCREGLAALGLQLPPKFNGDYRLLASFIRQIVRFAPEGKATCKATEQTLNSLAISFHPDPAERKAAAARAGYLFDERSGQAIVDYGGIHAGLDEIGYRTGTA